MLESILSVCVCAYESELTVRMLFSLLLFLARVLWSRTINSGARYLSPYLQMPWTSVQRLSSTVRMARAYARADR